MRKLLIIGIATLGLTACGGGGGSGAPAAVPPQGPGGRASASISFTIPVGPQHVANVGRVPQDVAAPAQRFSIFEDGAAVFTDVPLQPGTSAGAGGGATATVTAGSGSASYTVTITVATGAGSHTFGVVVTAVDGSVLATAQGTYALSGGGGTTAVTLPLSGGIASGYIECATLDQMAAGNNCANYANFDTSTSLYTFTAVAADSSGYPIGAQLANGGPVSFANGAYKVIESPSDNPAIVSVSGGPWSSPGSAFSAATGTYGNAFSVRCINRGTAQLQLQLVGGAPTVAVAGYAYDPSKYPAPNAVLPIGTRSASSVSVNCSASGSLTID